jgi:peptidoglycan/xylan/chitin deacetylase (PgdA/CDA1 family)
VGGSIGMIDSKRFVKRLSHATDRLVAPPAGVTMLIYHRVGGSTGGAVDLDPDVFERQLHHLAEHHTVVTLDDAVAQLAAGQVDGWAASGATTADSPPTRNGRSVVLTFDDGTTDFTEYVVPALARHGLPATLYAATGFIDEGHDFPWGAPPTSWAALRDALTTGLITVGSHTHSHWLLDRLDACQLDDDLDRSCELIASQLGAAPTHFAYPKAIPGSPQAEIAVRRRFLTAALAGSRVNRPGHTDLHRLWRTPIQRSDSTADFAAKAAGGLRLEGELRALAVRARARGATR